MPYSYAVYTGNGSTTQYAITFPYIRKEHVKVYVNYVDTAYTYANNTTVQLATAPANGLRVEVRRVTPANSVLVDYTDGSTLVAADLDTSNLQHLYLEQELDDALKQSIAIDSATGLPTAGSQRIINVGNPVNAQDAATKNYVDLVALAAIPNGDRGDITVSGSGTVWTIDSSAITDAKVASNAAIAGTKINPNFGTQSIATSGNITLSGTTSRFQGDFTNGTLASRAYFQSSTTNGLTSVGALPNGTSTTAGLLAHNNSAPTNSAYIGTVIDNVGTYLRSTRVGSGTSLPLYIQTGNTPTTRMTFDTAGDITIASTRIKGSFSYYTAPSARTCFKSSTTDESSFVTVLPNGTAQESGFWAVNKSYDTATPGSNCCVMGIDSYRAYLFSATTDSATTLDLVLGTDGTEGIRIDTLQNVLIGVASANPLGSNLQISSGITFPAAPVVSTDPNTLDKYEEGTWTPTIAGATTTGVGTYTTQVGRYTQIGNVITLHFNLTWTAHTGTGSMRLAGLPVTSANVTNLVPIALCYANNLTITGVLSCNVLPNNTYASLNAVNNGTGTALAMDTAATIAGTITYQTA